MSSPALPTIYLARHGETPWTLTGQHTGRTDLSLTPRGEEEACRLGARLAGHFFALVLTSPSERARRTCELAGFGAVAAVDPDLLEWDYGDYEGLRTAEIRKTRPGWNAFRDGVPGGESLEALGLRADRVVARLRAASGDALIFSHRDFMRALTARWLDLPVTEGRRFHLGTAALSILGYDHDPGEPVVRLWNDDRHLAGGDLRSA